MFNNLKKAQIWHRLSTRSRRAIMKTKKKWGHKYYYKPRGDLLQNISAELKIEIDEVYELLLEIRQELLKSDIN